MKTSLVDFHLVERESVEVSVQGAASGCGQVGAMKNSFVLQMFSSLIAIAYDNPKKKLHRCLQDVCVLCSVYSSGMTSTRNISWVIDRDGSAGKIGCPPALHEQV